MKTFLLACVVGITVLVTPTQAQTPAQYAVVVGAFSVEANANRFSKFVQKKNFNPTIQLNEVKKLYYVVIQETNDHDGAVAQVKKLQQEGPFRDAWLFNRNPAPPIVETPPEPVIVEEKPVVIEPVVEKPKVLTHADSVRMMEDKIKAEVAKKTLDTKKGSMAKLDYIFFYRDAAILRPESRYSVDKLVDLMNENPTVNIRIHGHTNGNDPGKIIKRTPDSTDFFSMENTVEDYGSAKELSQMRAEQIRDYLVVKGINKKRMTVKAWGGKKGLFQVDDDRAEANVRVEIEVVKN